MGSSVLEAFNFDIFICMSACLDVSDVIALSKCSKRLREFALTHQIWVELGRRLVLKGIPLPTEGFKSPDDLSPDELVESVIKAHKIYRGWTSRSVRATKMTLINEGDNRFNRAVTRILPITSDIVLMMLGHSALILWDVVRGIKLAELSAGLRERFLSSSVFSYEVDLTNKILCLLTHKNAMIEDRETYVTFLMNVDFGQMDSDLTEEENTVRFEEVISFCDFAAQRRFGNQIILVESFILDVQERRLCQVYTERNILLFVVLDWNERKAAFIDTGISSVPIISRVRPITFVAAYVCTWDARNERLVLTIDTGRGTLHQHVYHASQFLPFMTSFEVLSPETYDTDTIPELSPIQYCSVAYGAQVPGNITTLVASSVYETAFQTPWHTFSGAKAPSLCSKPFLVRLRSDTPDNEPSPLRGNMYIDFPPSTFSTTIPDLEAVFSLARNGPTRHRPWESRLHCVRYGTLAWVNEQDSMGLGPIRSVRLVRFSYPSSGSRQLPQDDTEVCTPLFMNGDPVKAVSDDLNGLVSLTLDEVHGRLFLVYRGGRAIALHYG